MDKAKFEEAKELLCIINCCEYMLNSQGKDYELLKTNFITLYCCSEKIQKSFFQWVANEKEIAEKKFNEI